jgi:hypothetical protein
MHRGKIIAAIVLVVAIGLIVVQRTGDQEVDTPTPGSDAPAAAALTAWPDGVSGSYTVDAAQTEVYWRIYRAGAMAALGHNHVISVSQLEGSVSTGDSPAAAAWNLTIPVNELVIDDPEIRARYGEDFESVPSEKDKADTKVNMLTEALLNGAVYPAISLTGRGVLGSLDEASLPVTIELAGKSIETDFPASISFDENAVTITGEVRMTHEDLGLVPFSIFGGAMAVGDEIDFSYRIRAIAGRQ